MNANKLERIKAENKGMTARRLANLVAKEEADEQAQRNQIPVAEMTITIEWKRSRAWGMNPHAKARTLHVDGTWSRRDGYTVSGCGYDKESSVVAKIFNDHFRFALWALEGHKRPDVYGMHLPEDGYNPYFSGGIGMSCYYRICEALGYKMEETANGKTFNVYRITKA